jgi:Ca-activated chloride channel family protein
MASLRVLPAEGSRRRRGITRTNILIVLDSSAEMEGRLGVRSRMEAVRALLPESLGSLATGGVEAGLRVFGIAPRARRDCSDSTLLVPLGRADRRAMRRTIKHLRATGYSPIAYSLEQAGADLPDEGNNAVILITGGADSCGGDACAAAAGLVRAGEVTRLYVLALGVEPAVEEQLHCIGEYGAVETSADLKRGLREVFRSALRLDLGTVSIFETGDGNWVASGTLRERLVVPTGRYDVKIVDGERSWLWKGIEIAGEMERTAGPRPTP